MFDATVGMHWGRALAEIKRQQEKDIMKQADIREAIESLEGLGKLKLSVEQHSKLLRVMLLLRRNL